MPLSGELEQALGRLAKACRILEMEGHGDMSLGHLSLRDPEGRGFWMKRNRIGLGEVLSCADFVLVDFDGRQLEGAGGRHAEWPIHSEIFLARSDVAVVGHTHPAYASVLSASNEPLLPYNMYADQFTELPRHVDEVALITTKEEGKALALTLGTASAVLMANHGVTFCGTSIEHATCVGVFLEKAAKAQIIGKGANLQVSMPSPATRARRYAQTMTASHIEHSWNYFCRKLDSIGAAGAGGPAAIFG